MSNPLKNLNDFYNNNIIEEDKKGNVQLFKYTFEKFKDYLYHEHGIELTDINYLDGYFIFAMGSNSVIHFKVKGCPKWKFGLWWTMGEPDEKGNKYLTAEVFCQHELYLDKFKPSRSTYCKPLKYFINKEGEMNIDYADYYINDIAAIIKFIQKHYYLAVARDWHGSNYNVERQKPIKAFFDYYKNSFEMWRNDKLGAYLNSLMIKELKKYATTHFSEYKWEVHDEGDYTSPRYELQVELTDEQLKDQETGCFGLFDNDEDEAHWEAKKKRLEKLANFLGYSYWRTKVSDILTFWNQKELDEYWSKKSEDNL